MTVGMIGPQSEKIVLEPHTVMIPPAELHPFHIDAAASMCENDDHPEPGMSEMAFAVFAAASALTHWPSTSGTERKPIIKIVTRMSAARINAPLRPDRGPRRRC